MQAIIESGHMATAPLGGKIGISKSGHGKPFASRETPCCRYKTDIKLASMKFVRGRKQQKVKSSNC